MIAWLIYSGLTAIAAFFLAFLVTLVRGGASKGDAHPLKAVLVSLAVTMGGPFLYVEAMTRIFGAPLGHAIRACYLDAPVDGPMQYYKIVSYAGTHASALVVGQEREQWGGVDRPILQVALSRNGNGWHADSYKVLYSSKLNQEGLVFPPYR